MKSIVKINLNENNIGKIINKFGYKGLGYYYLILKELKKEKELMYPIEKLDELSQKIKIPKVRLKRFIIFCTKLLDENMISVFSLNKEYFWNNDLLKSKIIRTKNRKSNKKKREKNIKLEHGELVNLTKEQYEKLTFKYGHIFINKAIEILNNWLKRNTKYSKKCLNKNNYNHFRKDGWVINETKYALGIY